MSDVLRDLVSKATQEDPHAPYHDQRLAVEPVLQLTEDKG